MGGKLSTTNGPLPISLSVDWWETEGLIPTIYRKPLGVRIPRGFPWPQNTRRDRLGKWEERQRSRGTKGPDSTRMARGSPQRRKRKKATRRLILRQRLRNIYLYVGRRKLEHVMCMFTCCGPMRRFKGLGRPLNKHKRMLGWAFVHTPRRTVAATTPSSPMGDGYLTLWLIHH